jgi:YebC/PmpR family DNA-binding regulatory protein
MSGHSKWHKIQHKKAVTDSKRSKLFGALSRDIKIASRDGSDPALNAALREAIDRAKKANLPQTNIDRLLSKDTRNDTEVWYEGYGNGGSAILVTALTDNTNRTVAEIRAIFKKHGGTLASAGSVKWKFNQQNITEAQLKHAINEDIELALIDAGAEDIKTDDLHVVITSAPGQSSTIESLLETYGATETVSRIEYVVPADQRSPLSSEDIAKTKELIEQLEEHPDIAAVYSELD